MGCFPFVVVVGGFLVRNTLYGKQRICKNVISKKVRLLGGCPCQWWPLPSFGGSGCPCLSSVVAGLVVLLAVVVVAFAFGGSCPCTLSCGSGLCLLWSGAAFLRWVVLPSRPLLEWCCSLFSSLKVVLLPSLGKCCFPALPTVCIENVRLTRPNF